MSVFSFSFDFFRCYLILIGVFYLKFGGVFVGLVGIGKIEIIKVSNGGLRLFV